jgi:hypothetical protein
MKQYDRNDMVNFANWYGDQIYLTQGDCGDAVFLYDEWLKDYPSANLETITDSNERTGSEMSLESEG